MSRVTEVEVGGLPRWIDAARLLGDATWSFSDGEDDTLVARAQVDAAFAADVDARLRNVGLGGRLLRVRVRPGLSRPQVREARLIDARRRRETTPGFLRRNVRLDEEGRISLTPESLALAIAERVAGKRVIDAGCGVGGNAIAFARKGCHVVAIDSDVERLRMAQHNADVYGVARNIEFVHGDAAEELPRLNADVVFVDPPWGADWNRERTTQDDFPLLVSALSASGSAQLRLLKVPPSFDPRTCPGSRAEAIFGEEPGDFRRVKFVLLSV